MLPFDEIINQLIRCFRVGLIAGITDPSTIGNKVGGSGDEIKIITRHGVGY
jgi:hypothetical protein